MRPRWVPGLTRARQTIALATAAAAVAVASPSCAGLLGVDGYENAAEVLCRCDELSFDGDCAQTVQRALGAAETDEQERWLAAFDAQRCGESCSNAFACYNQPPVCRAAAESCRDSIECCGYVGGHGGCCSAIGKGPVCCASCQTCSEALLQGDIVAGVPFCAESGDTIAALIDCITDNADLCCGPDLPCDPSCTAPVDRIACSRCYTVRCPEEVAACQADARP